MKAKCENCKMLKEIDYPRSILNDGKFTIKGTCSGCGLELTQKEPIPLVRVSILKQRHPLFTFA